MDSKNPKSNEMERRVSMRNSLRVSVANGGDADDDDFDFAAGMVSDGFRPASPGVASTGPSPATAAPSLANSGFSDNNSIKPSRPASQRPSSISKPPRAPDSFALRHDGAMGPIQERALTRSSSASTDSTVFAHTETPYRGPSGPSHPYQMYPQDVRLARTMSVATTSTVPVSESSYTGPRGPTHPYGMYPQGTVPDTGESSRTPAPVAVMPVGFGGMPDQYQRRLGPDGEDIADMIGPDGHTEQLPPYTRYPDETYNRKIRDAGESNAVPAPVIPGAIAGVAAGAAVATAAPAMTVASAIPGAGGLGLATRNPEFDSTDDLGPPQSRHSSRTFASDASHHEVNVGAAGLSEKGKQMKPWQAWMTRRLWGVIPYWAVCLTIGVLLLMGIILGSVIGTFLSKHRKPGHKGGDSPSGSASTITITYDATPIPTPTNLAPLAVGTFGMPFSSNSASNTCFNDTTQSQAWNCNVVISGMVITINRIAKDANNSTGDYVVSIHCNQTLTAANYVYSYGEQPPLMLEPQVMELVNDTYEPSRGPAWFKMVAFNKTVIIPESFLSTTSGSSKRAANQFEQLDSFKRKGVARSGDKPWMCTWPDTMLELFIYPNQNSSWYRGPPSSTSTTASASTATGRSGVFAGSYLGASSAASSTSPFGPVDTGVNYMPPPPPYPRVLKLEERRIQDLPVPYCTQVEIGESGVPAKPVLDSNGRPITVIIEENEPLPPGSVVSDRVKKRTLALQEDELGRPLYSRSTSTEMSECGCMWFLT